MEPFLTCGRNMGRVRGREMSCCSVMTPRTTPKGSKVIQQNENTSMSRVRQFPAYILTRHDTPNHFIIQIHSLFPWLCKSVCSFVSSRDALQGWNLFHHPMWGDNHFPHQTQMCLLLGALNYLCWVDEIFDMESVFSDTSKKVSFPFLLHISSILWIGNLLKVVSLLLLGFKSVFWWHIVTWYSLGLTKIPL